MGWHTLSHLVVSLRYQSPFDLDSSFMQTASVRHRLLALIVYAGLIASGAAYAQAGAAPRATQIENAVVKIFTTARPPDVFRPWSRAAPSDMSGSGVVIAGDKRATYGELADAAGQLPVFAGGKAGVKDNTGQLAIPAGKALGDADILGMNWLAEGVIGQIAR